MTAYLIELLISPLIRRETINRSFSMQDEQNLFRQIPTFCSVEQLNAMLHKNDYKLFMQQKWLQNVLCSADSDQAK